MWGRERGQISRGRGKDLKMKRDPKGEKRGIFCLYYCIVNLSLIIALI